MKLKLLFALLIVSISFAQDRCGTEAYMQKLLADPVQKQKYLESQAKFEIELQKLNSQQKQNTPVVNSTNATVRIPVAVHFPSVSPSTAAANEALKTCLRRLAQTQIARLNADYNATNSDLVNWTSSDAAVYPGVNYGVMDVNWELATQNHPTGTGLVNGNLAVTFGTNFLDGADQDATWAGYCNLVVRNIGGTTLGYSPLGGRPEDGMTVVIDNDFFGAAMTTAPATCSGYVPQAPYNLGRTLTHELGHFFNLFHTFQGCGSTCTNTGDRVCDTPPANAPEGDCVGAGSTISCGVAQLTMNYMDYPPDACMYMFTAGQTTRMTAWYNNISAQLATNVLGTNSFVNNNFSISPNPNNGTFAIRLKELTDQYNVLIIDSLGRIVYDNQFNQTIDLVQNIKLDGATTGVYFVTIESNGESVTKKIMVK